MPSVTNKNKFRFETKKNQKIIFQRKPGSVKLSGKLERSHQLTKAAAETKIVVSARWSDAEADRRSCNDDNDDNDDVDAWSSTAAASHLCWHTQGTGSGGRYVMVDTKKEYPSRFWRDRGIQVRVYVCICAWEGDI